MTGHEVPSPEFPFIVLREGEDAQRLGPGDAFFEPAGRIMLRFDNASDTEPAEIVCFYLTDGDERPLVEMLDSDTNRQS